MRRLPTESADDATLDELLPLAHVSYEAVAARRWLEDALRSARATRATLESQLAATTAIRTPKPPPAKHNAPLMEIEEAAGRLIAALEQLRRHPYAHGGFWRFKAFGSVYASGFERAGVMPTLTNVRAAAHTAQIRRTGRPRNFGKQQVVDLALAFCARFSPKTPTSDVNNFFPRFAKRFFEQATGLSVAEEGHGIDRQIRAALRRLRIEKERAALLKKYSSQITAGFVC
jgi:hypothetical protein